ncbi:Homeodomain transcription factor [Mycena sanguinolenta]|uniref:Homeodomain transcription factor n=1 Tax=Mycena sanguinolenta TaxID=230812 RepID=A0A8H6XBQ2_9AGAR|nr:Homeodomain transcription factor [Mycena sanguinolenta]
MGTALSTRQRRGRPDPFQLNSLRRLLSKTPTPSIEERSALALEIGMDLGKKKPRPGASDDELEYSEPIYLSSTSRSRSETPSIEREAEYARELRGRHAALLHSSDEDEDAQEAVTPSPSPSPGVSPSHGMLPSLEEKPTAVPSGSVPFVLSFLYSLVHLLVIWQLLVFCDPCYRGIQSCRDRYKFRRRELRAPRTTDRHPPEPPRANETVFVHLVASNRLNSPILGGSPRSFVVPENLDNDRETETFNVDPTSGTLEAGGETYQPHIAPAGRNVMGGIVGGLRKAWQRNRAPRGPGIAYPEPAVVHEEETQYESVPRAEAEMQYTSPAPNNTSYDAPLSDGGHTEGVHEHYTFVAADGGISWISREGSSSPTGVIVFDV